MVENKEIDVVFFEVFEEERNLFEKSCPSHIKAEFRKETIQESHIKKCPSSLISIRTQSKIPESWSGNLQGILTRSTGYEYVYKYCKKTKSEALCGYLPSYCSRAVGEQAILLMMSLFRKLKKQTTNFNVFNRDGITGIQCQDKKILVIGVGNIGAEIVDIAKSLRMKVAGVDIDKKFPNVEYVDLDAGLAWADAVICALPLTEETRGMLEYNTLQKVKNGAIFINIARGEITPLQDLNRLLDEGILGGLGLDVYENEKIIAECFRGDKALEDQESVKIIRKMKSRDDVIFTPHNAFNTKEALEEKVEQSIKSAVTFFSEKRFPYPIPQEIEGDE